jgi:hypothetical protein
MHNILLRYIALPPTIKGLTVEDESGDYNIYLNAKLTYEAHTETLQHEMKHITSDDFSKLLHIKEIEK